MVLDLKEHRERLVHKAFQGLKGSLVLKEHRGHKEYKDPKDQLVS